MNIKRVKLFLVSFICLFSFPALAQEKIKEGEITINNRVYSVSKNDPKYRVKRLLISENNAFIQKQKNDLKPYVSMGEVKYTSTETLISAFIKVLGRTRLKELSPYGRIAVSVYPDYTGKIKATEFYVISDHPITMNELDRINSYIKKNVSFQIPKSIGPDQKIKPILQSLSMDNILEKGR